MMTDQSGPPSENPGGGRDEVHPSSTSSAAQSGISAAAVARLSLYLRELRRLSGAGVQGVSSSQLGSCLGVTAAIVRRDLAALGNLGKRGVGYDVVGLAKKIRTALGADQVWNVGLIGTGSLGTALLRYRGFAEQGLRLVAAFDIRPDRVGDSLGGVPVLHMSELESAIEDRQISLAILAVPADAAQSAAELLAAAGITGILNFAPITLSVGGGTCVANVDLAIELQQLSFAVLRRSPAAAPSAEPKKP